MNKPDYESLYDLFSRYGADLRISIDPDMQFVPGSSRQYSFAGRNKSATINVRFCSTGTFDQFVEDIIHLSEIADEEHLRQSNPTLQRAYEDYQLLLKLSK